MSYSKGILVGTTSLAIVLSMSVSTATLFSPTKVPDLEPNVANLSTHVPFYSPVPYVDRIPVVEAKELTGPSQQMGMTGYPPRVRPTLAQLHVRNQQLLRRETGVELIDRIYTGQPGAENPVWPA